MKEPCSYGFAVFLYSFVGVSLYGHSGVFTGRRQYPWLETPVPMRGNCSFPPGNGSSDVGNGDFNCRKINFDAWCGIFFLHFSYTVLQINGICNVICNSICNAIIAYLSVCYFDFVADGRCFLFFKLLRYRYKAESLGVKLKKIFGAQHFMGQ